MADKKLRFAMLTYFKKKLSSRGVPSQINQFKEQWAADALIDEYGYDDCINLVDWYFDHYQSPNWTWFTYNIDNVISFKSDTENDLKVRKMLREAAKEWLKDE